MSQKEETVFRRNHVIPFLKTLTHTFAFPIQQVSIRGTPDFLLVSRGIFVGLELKAAKGSLDSLQLYNLTRIKTCGGIAMVAYPLNWLTIKSQLIQIDEGDIGDQDFNWDSLTTRTSNGSTKVKRIPGQPKSCLPDHESLQKSRRDIEKGTR